MSFATAWVDWVIEVSDAYVFWFRWYINLYFQNYEFIRAVLKCITYMSIKKDQKFKPQVP